MEGIVLDEWLDIYRRLNYRNRLEMARLIRRRIHRHRRRFTRIIWAIWSISNRSVFARKHTHDS